MIRFLTLTVLLIGALALSQATLHAQDRDAPVAGPDETIYYGEVPGPPGTEVWAEYLVGPAPDSEGGLEIAVCGRTTTEKDSSFVLVVDADCAGNLFGPTICWGKGSPDCKGHLRSPLPDADNPGRGDSVDLGTVIRPEDKPVGVQPDGTVGVLPSTGIATTAGETSGATWPLWLGGLLITAALAAGAGSFLLRRVR